MCDIISIVFFEWAWIWWQHWETGMTSVYRFNVQNVQWVWAHFFHDPQNSPFLISQPKFFTFAYSAAVSLSRWSRFWMCFVCGIIVYQAFSHPLRHQSVPQCRKRVQFALPCQHMSFVWHWRCLLALLLTSMDCEVVLPVVMVIFSVLQEPQDSPWTQKQITVWKILQPWPGLSVQFLYANYTTAER